MIKVFMETTKFNKIATKQNQGISLYLQQREDKVGKD